MNASRAQELLDQAVLKSSSKSLGNIAWDMMSPDEKEYVSGFWCTRRFDPIKHALKVIIML